MRGATSFPSASLRTRTRSSTCLLPWVSTSTLFTAWPHAFWMASCKWLFDGTAGAAAAVGGSAGENVITPAVQEPCDSEDGGADAGTRAEASATEGSVAMTGLAAGAAIGFKGSCSGGRLSAEKLTVPVVTHAPSAIDGDGRG